MAEGGSNIQSNNNYPDRMQQGASAVEEELATKTLHIISKRFYVDVKQNRRGRFIKITEVATGGRKNRIILSMSVATELRDHLDSFDQFLHTLGEINPNNPQLPPDGRLRSAIIVRDDRKYYLDLKENQRGRFLRISMIGINAPRIQIGLPAQGLQELRDTINNFLQEFGIEDDKDSIESPPVIEPTQLPESKHIRIGKKNFYFDIGSNDRGIFLRIAEVRANSRTAITIPEKAWSRFRDNINEFILAMEKERNNTSTIIDNSQLNTGNPTKSSSLSQSGNDEKKN